MEQNMCNKGWKYYEYIKISMNSSDREPLFEQGLYTHNRTVHLVMHLSKWFQGRRPTSSGFWWIRLAIHKILTPIYFQHHSDITNGRNINLFSGDSNGESSWHGRDSDRDIFSVRTPLVSLGMRAGFTLTGTLTHIYAIKAQLTSSPSVVGICNTLSMSLIFNVPFI